MAMVKRKAGEVSWSIQKMNRRHKNRSLKKLAYTLHEQNMASNSRDVVSVDVSHFIAPELNHSDSNVGKSGSVYYESIFPVDMMPCSSNSAKADSKSFVSQDVEESSNCSEGDSNKREIYETTNTDEEVEFETVEVKSENQASFARENENYLRPSLRDVLRAVNDLKSTITMEFAHVHSRLDAQNRDIEGIKKILASTTQHLARSQRKIKMIAKPEFFPLNSTEDFEQCEQYLSDLENYNVIVDYFTSVGGTDIPNSLNLMVKDAFTNALCRKMVYYGRSVNKLKLQGTTISKAMFDALKQNTNNAISGVTLENFDGCLYVALDLGKQRSRNDSRQFQVQPQNSANM